MVRIGEPAGGRAPRRAALAGAALLLGASAAAAADRHAGYYYPPPATTETYTARTVTLPDAIRETRLGFVIGITQQTMGRPYPPRFVVFAKGDGAQKLIIVALEDDVLDTVYRARALFAMLTSIARTTPVPPGARPRGLPHLLRSRQAARLYADHHLRRRRLRTSDSARVARRFDRDEQRAALRDHGRHLGRLVVRHHAAARRRRTRGVRGLSLRAGRADPRGVVRRQRAVAAFQRPRARFRRAHGVSSSSASVTSCSITPPAR